MKIKMMKEANIHYISTTGKWMPINWKWETVMELVSEETLEVETDYLFNDQFNTAGLTDNHIELLIEKFQTKHGNDFRLAELAEARISLKMGLRVMESCVDEVIDDIRDDFKKCGYCGEHCYKDEDVCPKCGKTEYLKSLTSLHKFRYAKDCRTNLRETKGECGNLCVKYGNVCV